MKQALFNILLLFLCTNLYSQSDKYFSPTDIAVDSTKGLIYVAGKTGYEIRAYSLDGYQLFQSLKTNLPPKGIAIAGAYLLATQSESEGELLVIDRTSFEVKNQIAVGNGACDICLSNDPNIVYVANQFSDDISVVDLSENKEIKRIPVLRQPMQIEISEDGKTLFAANFITAKRADLDTVTAEVTVIDLESGKAIKHLQLANGSNALRGMARSADGQFIFISHNLGRFQVPTTQLEQGWMNTSALSVIDINNRAFVATVLLDEPEYGAAGSWGIDCTNENVFVAHSGTHDFSKIDYKAFLEKLEQTQDKESLSYDLRFLSDIRERIKVDGNGPRAIQAIGNKLYVSNYFSDNLNVFTFHPRTSNESYSFSEATEMDSVRLGEMYFNDATYCFQGWQSCNGCHPDEGRTDGLNWDLLNDGMGNPKNCKSMLVAHSTAPSMITGIRPSAEAAVRAGFRHIQFTQIEEGHAAAVDAYLKSLKPVPSPYLINGELSEKAQKGKEIFNTVGCKYCHSGPYYTDQKKHEMGVQGEYDHQNTWDTPSLLEVWRTGPYLHDGRSATILDMLEKDKHGLRKELSKEELKQLAEYVLSL